MRVAEAMKRWQILKGDFPPTNVSKAWLFCKTFIPIFVYWEVFPTKCKVSGLSMHVEM